METNFPAVIKSRNKIGVFESQLRIQTLSQEKKNIYTDSRMKECMHTTKALHSF